MATVKPELTIEQAELLKAALLSAKFQGNMAELVKAMEITHSTLKALESALSEAKSSEVSIPPAAT